MDTLGCADGNYHPLRMELAKPGIASAGSNCLTINSKKSRKEGFRIARCLLVPKESLAHSKGQNIVSATTGASEAMQLVMSKRGTKTTGQSPEVFSAISLSLPSPRSTPILVYQTDEKQKGATEGRNRRPSKTEFDNYPCDMRLQLISGGQGSGFAVLIPTFTLCQWIGCLPRAIRFPSLLYHEL